MWRWRCTINVHFRPSYHSWLARSMSVKIPCLLRWLVPAWAGLDPFSLQSQHSATVFAPSSGLSFAWSGLSLRADWPWSLPSRWIALWSRRPGWTRCRRGLWSGFASRSWCALIYHRIGRRPQTHLGTALVINWNITTTCGQLLTMIMIHHCN